MTPSPRSIGRGVLIAATASRWLGLIRPTALRDIHVEAAPLDTLDADLLTHRHHIDDTVLRTGDDLL